MCTLIQFNSILCRFCPPTASSSESSWARTPRSMQTLDSKWTTEQDPSKGMMLEAREVR